LLSRTGALLRKFPDHRQALALSDDGTRLFLRARGQDRFDCVDDEGRVLATITPRVGYREGDDDRPYFEFVPARGFEQVILFAMYDGNYTLHRYAIPSECRPN
jgi:hypothetical protein